MKHQTIENIAKPRELQSNNAFLLILLVCLPFFTPKTSAQDHVKLNAKFLKSRTAQWGLTEVPETSKTEGNLIYNDYFVFGAKDKAADKRNYFFYDGTQMDMAEVELPDSLRTIITIGFYGLAAEPNGLSTVYQTDNLCSLSKLFEDMAFNADGVIWHQKNVTDLKVFVYNLPEETDSALMRPDNHSKYLYVIQDTKTFPEPDTVLGAPIDSLALIRNGIMVKYHKPLKTDLQFAAAQKITRLGFELHDNTRPSLSKTNKDLWVKESAVEVSDNTHFITPAIVGNMPILKGSRLPREVLIDNIFSWDKEQTFELKNLEFATYETLNKSKLIKLPPTDTLMKPAITELLKEMDIDLDPKNSKFYLDSTLAGVYVTGLSNEGVNPEYVYFPFFKQTYFFDFEPRGFLNQTMVKTLVDSIEIQLLGVPLAINRKEFLFEAPAIFKGSGYFKIAQTGYNDVVKFDVALKTPTNLLIGYTPLQESTENATHTASDSVKTPGTTVFYLDIAELDNKRVLQYFLQAQLDSLAKEEKNYLLFLSNGSNPIIDSNKKGGYMDVIKKISFLYPETASPRSDKNKLVESLITEELPTENMHIYFFLSPVSYNRFKEYMINELQIQYHCDVTIIVESLESQRIDEAYKHIDLTEKSK